MSAIYADHGSAEFNARMHDVCLRIASDVEQALGNNFVALILGGGYGRGEGGVIRVDGVEQPYNDLDFTLIVKRRNDVPWNKLDAISEHYEEEIHIDVDFSRPLTLHDIETWREHYLILMNYLQPAEVRCSLYGLCYAWV